MKSVNTYYKSASSLDTFIKEKDIKDNASLLIQVFTSYNDKLYIEKLIKVLVRTLPSAVIIGSTTDGEIMNGSVSTGTTVINFTQFNHTHLEAKFVVHKEDGYFSGRYLANMLVTPNTKLLISFVDGLNTNGEAFLDGIASVRSDTVVAGGLAGDNATFQQTYVFTKEGVIQNGAVAVALNSQRLKVNTEYKFNWHAVGKELRITKVEGNRVYTIEDKTAVEIYEHYLGSDISEHLPAIGTDFPLIVKRQNTEVARAVLSKHNDGSLSFAGNLRLDDKVQFGYADETEILNSVDDFVAKISKNPVEALFVYSCMSRRHFMPESIKLEILPLENIAPVSGFFTNGEFFTLGRAKLMNQAMTVVALNEEMLVPAVSKEDKRDKLPSLTATNALINLINVTTKESMEKQVTLVEETRRDVLTGLPNRKIFKEEMDKVVGRKKSMTLFFIDMDKLKDINDRYGHHIGDKAITLIGKRIKESLRAIDIVIRFGGDEFIVMLNDISEESIILSKIATILSNIVQPATLGEHHVELSASIGISSYPKDTKNVETLLKFADTAMYSAKEKGGNGYAFYDESMMKARA